MLGCKPLTQEEQRLLLRALPNLKLRMLFRLLLFTGFRISEALSLDVKDVYGQDRVLVMKRNMKGKIKSRDLLLHPELGAALKAYVDAEGLLPHDPLFKDRLGNRLKKAAAWKALRSAVRRAGLVGRVSFHSARKSFADQVHSHFKFDLVKTSKALGHASVLSTASYLSFKTEELDSAVLHLQAPA